jgi:hypothetical protein
MSDKSKIKLRNYPGTTGARLVMALKEPLESQWSPFGRARVPRSSDQRK